jgi:signal transduction histidine kinase
MEHDKLAIRKESFGLKSFLQDVVKLFHNEARLRHIHLSLLMQDSEAFPQNVCTDPRRLRQVLINLLSNAIKFTQEHGAVWLQASAQMIDPTEKAETGRDREIHLIVRDNGPGIGKAVLSKLFQPFTQGDASLSRKAGGTGLGLAICKQLAELLDGKIWVETQEGSGTDFHFTFATTTT